MNRAEITMSVINELKDTQERDVDFLFGQLADCVRDSDRRDVVRSFRRQLIVVASETAQDRFAAIQEDARHG
jgi:hypothetical protein